MKVAALAGGVGGAKLLVGLQRALAPGELTAIVNTADDADVYGVHVSPDVDIVTYWLAGIADTEKGWGIRGDTWEVLGALAALGEDVWFRLGDRDFATCLWRTHRLVSGESLSSITASIAASLSVPTRVLPMTDDPVETWVTTQDGRALGFQDYFVREHHAPAVASVEFRGIDRARPAPGVLEALHEADIVVVCPSNPIVSIGPILAVAAVRDALRSHPRAVAVSPIVQGKALKGPADRLLEAAGIEVSPVGVASLYADWLDVFVFDRLDEADAKRVQPIARAVPLDTIMVDAEASEKLARQILEL